MNLNVLLFPYYLVSLCLDFLKKKTCQSYILAWFDYLTHESHEYTIN